MLVLKHSLLKRAKKTAACLWSVIFCIGVLSSISACAAGPIPIAADLGKQSSLALGQKVSINGEPLAITFNSVVNDSRCPTGVT